MQRVNILFVRFFWRKVIKLYISNSSHLIKQKIKGIFSKQKPLSIHIQTPELSKNCDVIPLRQQCLRHHNCVLEYEYQNYILL